MTAITIQVTQTVPLERMHNCIVGAFEGGSNYWLNSAKFVSGVRHSTPRLVWYGEESVFAQDVTFEVGYDNPEGEGETSKIISSADLVAGMQIMATKYPQHFADLIAENDDATTHDVFMQCVVLSDIVYG